MLVMRVPTKERTFLPNPSAVVLTTVIEIQRRIVSLLLKRLLFCFRSMSP